MVEAVADHEGFLQDEADMVDRYREHPSVDAVEERAHPHLRRLMTSKMAQEEVETQAGVDHVLDEQHLSACHVESDVTGEAHPTAVGSEGAQRQEVDLQAAVHGADQVGEEGEAAAQHADDDGIVLDAVGDLGAQRADPQRQVVAAVEEAWCTHAAGYA